MSSLCWQLPTAHVVYSQHNGPMATQKEIGQRIVESRKSKKMTQEDLAGLADMDRSYLSEVENGYKNLSVSSLQRIAEALGVKASWLLGE